MVLSKVLVMEWCPARDQLVKGSIGHGAESMAPQFQRALPVHCTTNVARFEFYRSVKKNDMITKA
jgi:hypothetical protein